MALKDKLDGKSFIFTAELEPPKGTDISHILGKLDIYRQADAVNVTDNQRAIMKISPWAISKVLIDNGIEPIMQLTCRDRNVLALQSDLLGASLLGVRNVLALGGDPPSAGDHPDAKAVWEVDLVKMIKMIKSLNAGKDIKGNALKGGTDYTIVAAMNPGAADLAVEYSKTKAKIEAGASFFQTQIVYDAEKFKLFYEKLSDLNPKIIVGITPLKSAKMARFMNEKIPGVHVPEKLIEEMENSKEPLKTGVEQAIKIINEVKKYAAGAHLMTLGREEAISEILNAFE